MKNHGSWAVLVLAIGASMSLVPACGGDDGGKGNGDGDGDGDGDLDIGDGDGDLDVSGGSGSLTACTSAEDCEANEICHPIANACTEPGMSCEDNSACPQGSYCDPTEGACLVGLPGSPCSGDDNCVTGSTCQGDQCACLGFTQEQEQTTGPLDIYFVFDRTASMGNDCAYQPGQDPPENSKACFATYALADYLTGTVPATDTRLAFQFMSYESDDGNDGACDAPEYSNPLVGLTTLPVGEDHELVEAISDEQFQGGFGTQIAGALRGIANFTVENETPGREMIGVLMTDGDANRCDVQDSEGLAEIIAEHLADTGIRTFIIGMDGATEENLEEMAIAGGAEPHDDFCGSLDPPCHYWNVGDGSGEAIADALRAIADQAVPFRCDYELSEVEAIVGGDLDTSTLNVQLTQDGEATIIYNVADEAACPAEEPGWYFDSNVSPTSFSLCENACDLVSSADAGATMSIVGGCSGTLVLR